MKKVNLFYLAFPLFLVSCVTNKKYEALNSDYKALVKTERSCQQNLNSLQARNSQLESENADLKSQVDYLKKNSNQVLSALQDMSVISAKQAESIKQSIENISQKDDYIKTLQAAIARKDSLNLILVTNLKSSLNDINDTDVNIKVEKGVVYIDISDKLLFNTGKYEVTQQARTVLAKVAKVLNAYPAIEFMVEGHTDTVPIRTDCMLDNWDLSVKRATSVVRILQKDYTMSPTRITAAGHGEYLPVADNSTAEGRAVNRRTRIIILPQLDQFFKLLVRK